jgi:hypothetical protein
MKERRSPHRSESKEIGKFKTSIPEGGGSKLTQKERHTPGSIELIRDNRL